MLELVLAAAMAVPAEIAEQPIAWEARIEGTTVAPARIESDRTFEAAALTFSSATDLTVVRLRASADGISWSDWISAGIDQDLTERGDPRRFTSIVHFGNEQRYLEFSMNPAARDVVVTFFPPPQTQARQLPPIILENLDGGFLPVRTRVEWGCPDGEGSRWTPSYTTVTHAVVHHTAGANVVADWDAEMRNIWYFHTITRGWGDIGYNYLIDPNGIIYEGRAGGPRAIGAHFSCRNSATVGISMHGTFMGTLPTPAALDALERLLAELARIHRLDPDAFTVHGPTGLNLPTIPGHRDANASQFACSTTDCPGTALYAHLPALRSDVAACPPRITTQPAAAAIRAGSSATLSVTATGDGPFSYRWFVGTTGDTTAAIEGATDSTLTISPQKTTSYWVLVSNGCGRADSETAVVAITGAARSRPTRRGD